MPKANRRHAMAELRVLTRLTAMPNPIEGSTRSGVSTLVRIHRVSGSWRAVGDSASAAIVMRPITARAGPPHTCTVLTTPGLRGEERRDKEINSADADERAEAA